MVQCSDGRVIDDEFTTTSDLTRYPGSLVVVEEEEPGRYWLHRVQGDDRVIEVWGCPRLGCLLVYDPHAQWGTKEPRRCSKGSVSRFWVWDENRWTTLRDYHIQPLLVPLDSQETTRVAYEYLQSPPVPPTSTAAFDALSGYSRWRKIDSQEAACIQVAIFAGTVNERRFLLPGFLTPERAVEWVGQVEGTRRLRNS